MELRTEPWISMDARAAAALRRRGGNLYVWLSGENVARARTSAPGKPIQFRTTPGDGWFVHTDPRIGPQNHVLIQWSRWPWPHFTPYFNPLDGSGLSDAVTGDAVDAFLADVFGQS